MAGHRQRPRNSRRVEARRPRLELPRLPKLPLQRIGAVLVGIAAPVLALWALAVLLDRPIRQVTVQGPFERVSVMQVEGAVGNLHGSGFLGVDLDAVRARVLAVEWIDEVVVRRRWPAEILVSVSEQVPAARWGDSGLLNTRGELFVRDARHVPAELPLLSGPEGTEKTVARRYLDTRARLAAAGLGLRSLTLDPRGSWRIELSNGIEVRFGREDFDARLRRFARIAAPLITDRVADVAYVDLRYSRGFAIGRTRADRREDQTKKGSATNG